MLTLWTNILREEVRFPLQGRCLSGKPTTDYGDGRTRPLRSPRIEAGRQHTSLECSLMSM